MLASSLALIVLSVPSIVVAADKKPLLSGATTEMLANTCAGCHGQNGASAGPSIPTIGGMSDIYFIETMEGYKNGDIPSTIMGRLAKGYSTKEIEQMAKYFSEQPYVAVTQKSDAALAAKGAKYHEKFCEKCHSEGGTLADDESGFLQGQWKAYLTAQLMDFKSKDREATKKMRKKMDALDKKHGDAGIKALIEYYSSNK
jgi:sulfide dehydrogenase cytochrome subunit